MATQTLALLLVGALPLALWLPIIWQYRRAALVVPVLIDLAAAGWILWQYFGSWSLLYSLVVAYKLFNYARIARGQMQADHLYKATRLTFVILTLAQVVLGLGALHYSAWPALLGYLLVAAQVVVGVGLVVSTQRHLRTTKTLQAAKAYTDAALPSISVLIPARNETEDLQACLQSMVASNYPKLEIIVLDDCSQNKHTSEIIRSFAHDGVRFLAGEEPTDNWLAKNYAYQQLAEAANGDYFVFCGADLQMSPNALRELITTLLEKDKSMLSVLPQNVHPNRLLTYLIQPARYVWELSLPRRLLNRPAVLSTCWVIKADVLSAAGGFKAVSRSITPESYFARFTARHDGYSFLRSNLLVSDKSADHQRSTAIRMRYPQLRKRPEVVLGVSLIEVLGIAGPLPTALVTGMVLGAPVAALAVFAYLLTYVMHLQVTGVMYGRSVIAGFMLPPLAAVYDTFLLHVSMFKYEFGEVRWKDRNICLPVMRFDEVPAAVPRPNRES